MANSFQPPQRTLIGPGPSDVSPRVLEAMGLGLAPAEAERLPQLNVIRVPDGVDEGRVRSRLLTEYQLEVGAGLGALAGKVWRIGLMGHSCNLKNVLLCVGAFQPILASEGVSVKTGVAEAAAQETFAR